jgi:hypothetical protein
MLTEVPADVEESAPLGGNEQERPRLTTPANSSCQARCALGDRCQNTEYANAMPNVADGNGLGCIYSILTLHPEHACPLACAKGEVPYIAPDVVGGDVSQEHACLSAPSHIRDSALGSFG